MITLSVSSLFLDGSGTLVLSELSAKTAVFCVLLRASRVNRTVKLAAHQIKTVSEKLETGKLGDNCLLVHHYKQISPYTLLSDPLVI